MSKDDGNLLGLTIGQTYKATTSDCCIDGVEIIGKLIEIDDGRYVFEAPGIARLEAFEYNVEVEEVPAPE